MPFQSSPATLSASAGRRFLAVTILACLGATLIYLPMRNPTSALWTLLLIAVGAGSLFMADRLRRATAVRLILTETDLREENGRILTTLDQVEKVERGSFAMKPANGFSLVLRDPAPRAWAPGLWWRSGRRLGVGGVVSAPPARLIAEQIASYLENRPRP